MIKFLIASLFFTTSVLADYYVTGKVTGGVKASSIGKGYDLTVNLNPSLGTEVLSGLNLFVGAHTADNYVATVENDTYEGVAGITYSLGPVSIGYGKQGRITGETSAATSVDFTRNEHYGVAFNINDDLSVSYGSMESGKVGYNGSNAQSGTPATRIVKSDSVQAAYTMGGASIRVADVNVTNQTFAAGANYSATIVSMGLAF